MHTCMPVHVHVHACQYTCAHAHPCQCVHTHVHACECTCMLHGISPTCATGRLNTERWKEMEAGKYTQRVLILSTQHIPFQRRTASTDKMVKAVSPPIKRKKSNVRNIRYILPHLMPCTLLAIRRGQRVHPSRVRVH